MNLYKDEKFTLRYTGLHFISNGRIGLSEQYNHICMMLIYFVCAFWLP